MFARNKLLATAIIVTTSILLGFLTRPVHAVTVPSGVPTEAPGSIVTLQVPDTRLRITGCASPNAFVQLFNNNTPIGTVVADSTGRFTKSVSFSNDDSGLHNIKLYYDDVNGRTSSIVTRNISLAAQAETTLDILLPTTIEHEPEPVRIGNYLIFRGTTCPLALVNVIINNNFTLVAQADERGNWYVIADTENYYVGGHTYEALSSLKGQTSAKTSKYQFTTVGQKSGSPTVRPELVAPRILEPKDLFLSSTRTVTFRGSAPTNTQLEIYIDDALQGSVFTNPLGEWSFVLNMQQQQHTVKVRACHKNSCSEFSNSVRVRYAGELQSCPLRFSLADYRYYGIAVNSGVDLEITSILGAPEYNILIDWGDASVETITLLNDSPTKLHHIYKLAGQYNGTITIEDSRGCVQTHYFSAQVGLESPANWWLLMSIPFTGILIILLSNRITAYRYRPLGSPKPSVLLPGLRPVQAQEPKPKIRKWYKD